MADKPKSGILLPEESQKMLDEWTAQQVAKHRLQAAKEKYDQTMERHGEMTNAKPGFVPARRDHLDTKPVIPDVIGEKGRNTPVDENQARKDMSDALWNFFLLGGGGVSTQKPKEPLNHNINKLRGLATDIVKKGQTMPDNVDYEHAIDHGFITPKILGAGYKSLASDDFVDWASKKTGRDPNAFRAKAALKIYKDIFGEPLAYYSPSHNEIAINTAGQMPHNRRNSVKGTMTSITHEARHLLDDASGKDVTNLNPSRLSRLPEKDNPFSLFAKHGILNPLEKVTSESEVNTYVFGPTVQSLHNRGFKVDTPEQSLASVKQVLRDPHKFDRLLNDVRPHLISRGREPAFERAFLQKTLQAIAKNPDVLHDFQQAVRKDDEPERPEETTGTAVVQK